MLALSWIGNLAGHDIAGDHVSHSRGKEFLQRDFDHAPTGKVRQRGGNRVGDVLEIVLHDVELLRGVRNVALQTVLERQRAQAHGVHVVGGAV